MSTEFVLFSAEMVLAAKDYVMIRKCVFWYLKELQVSIASGTCLFACLLGYPC